MTGLTLPRHHMGLRTPGVALMMLPVVLVSGVGCGSGIIHDPKRDDPTGNVPINTEFTADFELASPSGAVPWGRTPNTAIVIWGGASPAWYAEFD